MKKINFKNLDLDLFYEKLDNGLEIFVLPKTNVNNIYVTFNTKYGSNISEFKPTDKNKMIKVPLGIAHFLEHKMFEQEDGSDIFSFYSERGADCNANTNYTKVGLVSLNKISPEGKTLYSISSIIDNEYEKVIKLIYLTNDKFAVLKRDDKRVPILDVYNINTGAKENRYILDNVETTDEATMSYREIVDCKYITDKNVLAILTMSIENGKHKEDIIFTTSFDNFNLKEAYKLAARDNALAVGMSDNGRVIYTGMDNGLYFIIKTNPFVSQNFSKEYLGTDDFNKLRGINMFNDSIYGFLFEDGKIKFNNF